MKCLWDTLSMWVNINSKHEKAGAPLIETPAHACRFVQSYSSWSCSPAELHYASDCKAKVQILFDLAMKNAEKVILQFELLSTYYSKKSCKMSYTPKFQFLNALVGSSQIGHKL